MTMMMGQTWAQLGSLMATVMFVYTIFEQFLPSPLRARLRKYSDTLRPFLDPYVRITFPEYTGERLMRSEAFTSIQTYLSQNSSQRAKRLKAELLKNSQTPLMLSLDDNEEITDEFRGVKLWWASRKTTSQTRSYFNEAPEEKRYYKLTFHRNHRDLVTGYYLKHVLEEAEVIQMKNRRLKLYTNSGGNWSHVGFEHPATFETLAMKPEKKEKIIKDLERFKASKEYYRKIGKAWKRGYLLYGPPGTGKSTMIAAMANFLNYDIYDLELTEVKNNTKLRKLLLNTSSKSIILIEDIDCSLDLTAQRKKKQEKEENEEAKDGIKKSAEEEEEKKSSKVTLSGLLNVIDGIWSSSGGERLFVFTTNFVEKLDPALIRRGRMDMHIEMSYCCFEAFKVLAKNYLDIKTHDLYSRIEKLFEEAEITPADAAENLMPKSVDEDVEACLNRLIEALETAKEEAKKKAEEEARKNAEKEVKRKVGKEQEQLNQKGVKNNIKYGKGEDSVSR